MNKRRRRIAKARRRLPNHGRLRDWLPMARRELLDRWALTMFNSSRQLSALPHRRGRRERDAELRARLKEALRFPRHGREAEP